MKKMFTYRIPLYAAVTIVIVVSSAAFLAVYRMSGTMARYELDLKDSANAPLDYGSIPSLANADFYTAARDAMIRNKIDFIDVNLSEMTLRLYRGGVPSETMRILSKGRPGSWWETPAGLYRIETKEKNHFSSFGKVYQPWSMQFQGNFFIHGWPYYPDGEPVASTYSGGCVRLATEDAKKIYDAATIGMAVLVFEKGFGKDDFAYARRAPDISAGAYLAADLNNNFVFLQKNDAAQTPIASLAKLMTALVTTEYVNLDARVTITNAMRVPTVRPRLVTGEKYSVIQLLYPLLIESSNEAAAALSRLVGPARFVELMNNKARALGMDYTRFSDSSGVDQNTISTADDLFNLAKYLYHNRSFILKVSADRVGENAYGPSDFPYLKAAYGFMNDPTFMGGGSGKSDAAGDNVLAIFNVTINRVLRPVVIIVLGSQGHAEDDVRALREWIEAQYTGA